MARFLTFTLSAATCLLMTACPAMTPEQTATATIRQARLFAIGGVGYAGRVTEPDKSLQRLVALHATPDVFTRLLKTASLEGQMYALIGLKRTSPPQFASAIKPYLTMTRAVHTAAGCTMMDVPVNAVVTQIQNGRYDPRSR